eukprot:4112170-Pyramimonas_sp.AAC.1
MCSDLTVAAQVPGAKVNIDTVTVGVRLLETDYIRLVRVCECENHSASQNGVMPRTQFLAACVLHTQAALLWGIQKSVMEHTPAKDWLVVIDMARHDETPLRVKTAGASSVEDRLPTNTVGTMQLGGMRPESTLIQAWTP